MLDWFARRMKEAREDEQGFTLIELLVVVIIIGILAAIAIPTFLGQRDKAQRATVQSDLQAAGTAINNCLLETDAAADCNTDQKLKAYSFNGSAKVDRTYTASGTVVTVEGEHTDNSTAKYTYSSNTGRISG